MKFGRVALTVIIAAAIPYQFLRAQESRSRTQDDVKKIVEQFYTLDSDGRWLGRGHADELQKFFTGPLLPEDFRRLVIIEKYSVGPPRMLVNRQGQTSYNVETEYSYWGYLDDSLLFRYADGAAPGRPASNISVNSLILTDKFSETSRTGDEVLRNVPLQWRMTGGDLNRISVDTAVRYVTQMRDRSENPVVRDNADRTLAELRAPSDGSVAPGPQSLATDSPVDALRRIWELGKSGKGLAHDGWNDQAQYFGIRPTWPWKRITVIGNDPLTNFDGTLNAVGDIADFTVSYAKVGYLDSSMRLKLVAPVPCSVAPDYCVSEARYTFRLSQTYWQEGRDGSLKAVAGPLAWRIISADPPVPWITVDVATRYVAEVRDRTNDPAIKANAGETISILNRYR